jgi:hypothetical protein
MSNLRANQADQALIQYEAGQELVAMQQMTPDSARTVFSISDTPWSAVAGYEPVIRPNGLVTGGVVTPTASTVDSITVAGATAYIQGELETVTGGALTTTDGLVQPGTGEFVIHSIIITSAGVIDVEAGTATTTGSGFQTTRAHASGGGPPLIGVDDIEIAQVRLSSAVGTQITTDEIRQVVGTSQERWDYPVYSEDYGNGEITFVSALPAIHTGSVPKRVYIEVYTPTFASLEPASDFVPPEVTHSQTSTEVYGGTIGASSSSLNQGSFTAYLKDGVTDSLINLKNEKIWVKFFPHRLRDPYILAQGTLGISRSFPAGDSIQAACTLTADGEVLEFAE